MVYLFIFTALAIGLMLGIVIGRLAGKNAGIAAATENRLLKESLAKTEAAQAALAEKIQTEFKNIANDVLVSGSRQVHADAQKQLDTLLQPLQSKLGEFQNRLEQTATAQGRDSAALKEQIRSLTDLNKNVGEEARRLADALKGDAKSRGNWGEMVLERLLEVAGLIRGTHYETQVSLKGEQGDFRPDVVVRLPDQKDMIIDSKVSLVHYEQMFGAANEEARAALRKEHLARLKKHVDDLGKKDYSSLAGVNSIDLVFMFVPIEGAFLEALNADEQLYDYAFRKNVVILTPGTLLVTLRLVAQMWQQDNQNKNALKIALEGGKLYDKFVGFVEDITRLGAQMDTTRKTYEDAMKKLNTGPGNLVTQSEKLRELGAKAKKRLALTAEDEE
ncbi:DNA recombination protein RmuC [Turneriella parva]|uniref:RmuC-domain protein n=1 Tax=Turneriella parva (strain ATCC BAA-1111 / DSM 21527 / NCTC 11395 / H) TaxID=869212 RepID=I4B8N7_TURPD|nr:DNA recombination protein RmuC [Turneriella parva]AFM13644.1 RmuC-domain protein [Turneriella parva DSM 21527]